MSMRSTVGFIVGCLIAAATPRVEAQEPSTRDAEARGLYDAGVSAYDGGRYAEALEHFQRAYELSGRAMLLYNIATAAERARQDELAVRTYEEFLANVPDTDLRERVETRIHELREQLARNGDRSSTADSPAPAGADPAPWIVVAAGAAVAVTGGVLLGVGLSDRAAVEDAPDGAIWSDGADEAYERGPAVLTSGIVLLPVGVALAAIGVVWAVAAPSPRGEQASLRLGPGSVALSGRF
jgi:tetratricopeptide (TPR) repeat protein